ncbi:hypothetical protein GCM10011514_21520 [Emticicia aquatilis]|uniref:HTH araC/xylS-type domain-containing protein n=1 Tax=Emticicia aquatilis TaxID=1537369 RepID=A0A916YQL8_9BACT|nr:AraC family transcriptional regulator [Emticicia aquatilis]GGD57112.1 hypothetical protein GCM10011514_21520 [Emticicia aquatilis]
MNLLIKNMVCNRCIRVVREELENLGLTVSKIDLGYVEIDGNPSQVLLNNIRELLKKEGFEIIEDHHTEVVEHIKRLIIDEIHWKKGKKQESQNFSDFLVKKTGFEYSYLSSLFSSLEKTTIEKYIINQKIELTKELLSYGEQNLSEIAWGLGYSSVAYLSNQFKQIVGMTPSDYKKQHFKNRLALDAVNNVTTIS